MVVLTLRRLMRSAFVALLLTWGFSALVGATADQSLLLLFGGLLIGVHAFLGYCRYHRRLSAVFRMQELSDEDYERIRLERHPDGSASRGMPHDGSLRLSRFRLTRVCVSQSKLRKPVVTRMSVMDCPRILSSPIEPVSRTVLRRW